MKTNSRKLTSPQSLNAYIQHFSKSAGYIKGICDIMRRSGRAGALQYVPELTWALFLQHVIDSLKPGGRCGIVMDELEHFDEFFKLFNPSTLNPELNSGERSWHVPLEEIETKNYDLKAVNPNRKNRGDTRTPGLRANTHRQA